jgi:DNA-binding PadR family transcriptional regulator
MTHAHAYGPPGFRGLLAMSGGRGRGRPGGGRHAGPGFGPWGGPPFGGPPFWRRGRRPRGDVRAAMLLVLAEEPLSGYGLMQEIENRSEGVWRPSPGSVYPVLQQLQDEGLVTSTDADGRKVFDLTDEGRRYVEEHADELREPWQVAEHGPRERVQGLMHSSMALAAAVQQVARLGNDEQAAQALAVLDEARRTIYRILADDDTGTQPEQQA